MKVIDLIEVLKTKDPYMEVLTEGLYDDYYPLEISTLKKVKVLKVDNKTSICYTVPFGHEGGLNEKIIDALVI